MNVVRRAVFVWVLFLLAPFASSQPAGKGESQIPPAEAQARDRLNSSPRHGEWVTVKDGNDTMKAWLVFPEAKDKAPVVVVIHEIFGLTDWVRSVADQLAADGFIAIAPDLLSGKGPNGGGTESVDRDGAVALVRGLNQADVFRRLNAAVAHATSLPAATKEFGSVGFCWGGGMSFAYAAEQPKLKAAVRVAERLLKLLRHRLLDERL